MDFYDNDTKTQVSAGGATRQALVEAGRWLALIPALGLTLSGLLSLPLPFLDQLSSDTKWMIGVFSVLAAGIMDLLRKSIHSSLEIRSILRHLESTTKHKMTIRDHSEAHRQLAHRLKSVTRSIKVIDTTPGKPGLRDPEYLRERNRLLKKGFTHERIALIRTEADLKAVLDLAEKTKSDNFRLGCFLDSQPEAPLFSSLLIDDGEVHLGAGWLGDPGRDSFDIEIQSREAAGRFESYFSVLFNRSLIIRDRHGFQPEVAARVREEFEHRSPVQVFQSGYPDDQKLVAMIQSSDSLDIVSYPKLRRPSDKLKSYFRGLGEAIAEGTLRHRRIIWNHDQARFVHDWLAGDDLLRRSGSLEIRYIDPTELEKPIFYFDLLDKSTVILAQDLMGDYWVQIQDKKFAKLLSDYFEMIWEKAKENWIKDNLRDYDEVNFGLLENIEKGTLGKRDV